MKEVLALHWIDPPPKGQAKYEDDLAAAIASQALDRGLRRALPTLVIAEANHLLLRSYLPSKAHRAVTSEHEPHGWRHNPQGRTAPDIGKPLLPRTVVPQPTPPRPSVFREEVVP